MNINFPYDHDNPENSQLLIALTGEPSYIKEELKKILAQFDTPYGKPCQGTSCGFKVTASVKTPVWNSKPY